MIGMSVPDIEGFDRVSGRLQFVRDIYPEKVLYGKLLLSDHPHADILSIDISDARKYPGVQLILTSKDVPGPNNHGIITPDQPVFADKKVRFTGDIIAAVFAESEIIAEEAIGLIKVNYRLLEGVFSPLRAMEEDAPKIHSDGNLIKEIVLNKGNVQNAFMNSDVIIEESYFSPFIDHAFLEPEAGIAIATKEGGVTVWYPTQGPFASRYGIARSLAIPEEKVQVISTPMGGAFGGKSDITIEIILALAAIRSSRPVKICLTRRESLRIHTKRHAYNMHYKTGATSNGKLTALWANIISDCGAYASWSADVIEQAVAFSGGPYVWNNVHVEGFSYYTNNAIGGAFRGFGINQVSFAIESQLDIMAKHLGIDPIDFRIKNALDVGLETITGEKLKQSVAIKQTLLKAKNEFNNVEIPKPSGKNKRVGIGVASGFKNIGGGRGFVNQGGAVIELKESGEVEVCASVCDMGQGIKTALIQIVSFATGISIKNFKLIAGDTNKIPLGTFAIGQRQVLLAGNALLKASKEFKEKILLKASQMTGILLKKLSISNDGIVDLNGKEVLKLIEIAKVTCAENDCIKIKAQYVAPQTYPLKGDLNPVCPIIKDGKIVFEYDEEDYRNYFSYNYATQIAVVEVDEETGDVQVLKILGFHDVGKTINPQNCLGQLEGGVLMGVGYALSEEFFMHNGINISDRLEHCGVPTALETPGMEFLLIEEPEPLGPFQAKGIGEIALVPTAPAITNAIYDALGVRITSLPASYEKILSALDKKNML